MINCKITVALGPYEFVFDCEDEEEAIECYNRISSYPRANLSTRVFAAPARQDCKVQQVEFQRVLGQRTLGQVESKPYFRVVLHLQGFQFAITFDDQAEALKCFDSIAASPDGEVIDGHLTMPAAALVDSIEVNNKGMIGNPNR